MLLRRITQHVKNHNWFAVLLDFFIVVVGVGVALYAEQWLEDRRELAKLERVERALSTDLFNIFFYAKERLAISECRKHDIQVLADLLVQTGEDWPGAPVYDYDSERLTFAEVLRSPERDWISPLWDSELSQGSLALMDMDRRNLYWTAFENAKYSELLQDRIVHNEARMKTLALEIKLTPDDRLRYLDILATLDTDHANLEVIAEHIVSHVEQIGFDNTQGEREAWREFVADQNSVSDEIYGDCRKPIVMPFLEE